MQPVDKVDMVDILAGLGWTLVQVNATGLSIKYYISGAPTSGRQGLASARLGFPHSALKLPFTPDFGVMEL